MIEASLRPKAQKLVHDVTSNARISEKREWRGKIIRERVHKLHWWE